MGSASPGKIWTFGGGDCASSRLFCSGRLGAGCIVVRSGCNAGEHFTTLWNLVKQEKMANTKVVLSGAIPDAGPVARAPADAADRK